jgi:hypothetical protein
MLNIVRKLVRFSGLRKRNTTGLVIEFADDAHDLTVGVPYKSDGLLRFRRPDYLELLDAARKARVDWLIRESADLVCETCKSFILPAEALYRLLVKLEGTAYAHYPDSDLLEKIRSRIIKSYPMDDETLREYYEGRLQHIPFIRDKKGALEWWDEAGPNYLAVNEVVFKFRTRCVCDSVYLRMYDNIVPGKVRSMN